MCIQVAMPSRGITSSWMHSYWLRVRTLRYNCFNIKTYNMWIRSNHKKQKAAAPWNSIWCCKNTHPVTPASGCGISHKCDLIFGVRRSGNGCARRCFQFAHACSEMKKKKSARQRKGSQCNSEGLCFETCWREPQRAESLNLIWSRARFLSRTLLLAFDFGWRRRN